MARHFLAAQVFDPEAVIRLREEIEKVDEPKAEIGKQAQVAPLRHHRAAAGIDRQVLTFEIDHDPTIRSASLPRSASKSSMAQGLAGGPVRARSRPAVRFGGRPTEGRLGTGLGDRFRATQGCSGPLKHDVDPEDS